MPHPFLSLCTGLLCAATIVGCAPDQTPVGPDSDSPVTPLDTSAVEPAAPSSTPLPPDKATDPTTPPPHAPEDTPQAIYPGVIVDREQGYVDLRGRVIGRAVEWLELLACRPGTLEHEAVVTLDADARHIQLALILLGLEPGQPAGTDSVDGQLVFIPPRGPSVELFFVLDEQPETETPANEWVVDQEAGHIMPGNRWLFVGSRSIDHDGKNWFLAEQNGTLISLVNFGDELIGRDTLQSDDGGNVFWTANTPQIPAEGTRITLRIRPTPALDPAKGPAEESPEGAVESGNP